MQQRDPRIMYFIDVIESSNVLLSVLLENRFEKLMILSLYGTFSFFFVYFSGQ